MEQGKKTWTDNSENKKQKLSLEHEKMLNLTHNQRIAN